MRKDHFDEDGRCGYCFEEWPCDGSGGAANSGVHKWQKLDQDRRYDIKRHAALLEEDRINELFEKLGYTMMVYPRRSNTMRLTRVQLLTLLERINDAEHGE